MFRPIKKDGGGERPARLLGSYGWRPEANDDMKSVMVGTDRQRRIENKREGYHSSSLGGSD